MFLCFGLGIMLCQQPAPPPQSDAARFCQVAAPLRWSRNDTPDTIRQARAHNAAGKTLCGWGR
jgi:hypothetical protein